MKKARGKANTAHVDFNFHPAAFKAAIGKEEPKQGIDLQHLAIGCGLFILTTFMVRHACMAALINYTLIDWIWVGSTLVSGTIGFVLQ